MASKYHHKHAPAIVEAAAASDNHRAAKSKKMEAFGSVAYEDSPEEYLREGSCLLRCEMALKLPVYVPVDKTSGNDKGKGLA